MKLGISTACFYPMCLEQAVEDLAAHDVKLVELFVNTFSETEKEFSNPLQERMRCSGMRPVSLHPFTSGFEPMLLFTEYERRFRDGIEFYKRVYFDLMNRMEIPILVLHGAKRESKCTDQLYFERYAALRRAGREYGIDIAQENVGPFKSHSLEFLCRMREYLHGDVSFVLDIKQAVRGGEDPMAMAKELGRWIIHTHLSDHLLSGGRQTDCLPVGEGEFDFGRYFRILEQQGFSGTGVVELYRESYRDYSQIYSSLERLREYC